MRKCRYSGGDRRGWQCDNAPVERMDAEDGDGEGNDEQTNAKPGMNNSAATQRTYPSTSYPKKDGNNGH